MGRKILIKKGGKPLTPLPPLFSLLPPPCSSSSCFPSPPTLPLPFPSLPLLLLAHCSFKLIRGRRVGHGWKLPNISIGLTCLINFQPSAQHGWNWACRYNLGPGRGLGDEGRRGKSGRGRGGEGRLFLMSWLEMC